MRISCVIGHYRSIHVLPGVVALLLPLVVHAQQVPAPVPPRPAPMVIVPPPPAVQFQQMAQQQHLRDQLQKGQQQQQLQQSVSDNTQRALPADSPTRRQTGQADIARRNRDRAAQQDLLDHYQRAVAPPPATHLQPANTGSSH